MTKLKKEIEPQLDMAEQRYPKILKLIMAYADYCDKNGDEDHAEHKRLEEKLHLLTGKDMSRFNLWEWWEGDGAENLAFNISLPEPRVVDNITKEDLAEIVRRLKTYQEPAKNETLMGILFNGHRSNYFQKFLKINFSTYNIKLFQRHKDSNGNSYEYSMEEIIEKIWNSGNHKHKQAEGLGSGMSSTIGNLQSS